MRIISTRPRGAGEGSADAGARSRGRRDRAPWSGLAALLTAGGMFAAPAGAAITGVCPDGSIFIVQSSDAIPCSQAKRVEPSDVPPIQPELLPRPYGWERFQREADPNNPYNLIEGQSPRASAPPPPALPRVPSRRPPWHPVAHRRRSWPRHRRSHPTHRRPRPSV